MLLQLGIGYVLYVGTAGVQPVYHILVHVEAQHSIAGLGQLDRQRKPDVAEANDAKQDLPSLGLCNQVLGNTHGLSAHA